MQIKVCMAIIWIKQQGDNIMATFTKQEMKNAKEAYNKVIKLYPKQNTQFS